MNHRSRADKATVKPKRRLLRAGVLALSGMLLVGGITVNGTVNAFERPVAAAAYELGPGIYPNGIGIGSFRHSDGSQVYCLEIAVPIKLGNKVDGDFTTVSAIPELSSASYTSPFGGVYRDIYAPALTDQKLLRQINWIYNNYGLTNSDQQAAAVQMAIWSVRYYSGANQGYLDLYASYQRAIEKHSPGTVALLNRIYAESLAAIDAEDQLATQGEIVVHASGAYAGVAAVPVGTIDLTVANGVLRDPATGQWVTTVSWPEGTSQATSVEWQGRPNEAEGWNKYYRVSFSGHKAYTVTPATLAFNKTAGQATGKPAGKPKRHVADLTGAYVDPDTVWQPVLSTATPSEFVQQGETFSDTVTFGVAKGSNPWRVAYRGGKELYAPITATGTLYGPFLSDPALNPSATPPNGAPVAGTATITTDTAKGPGTYPVNADIQSLEAGYYSWVWNIEFDKQRDGVKNPSTNSSGLRDPSLPLNYYFTDGFGVMSERQITPTVLDISTKLSADEVVLGETFTDTVSVELARASGGWLQGDNGKRIPAVLRGTMYQIDTLDGEPPTQSATVPAEAKQIGSVTTVTVDTPGKEVVSADIRVPLTATGYVSMVWCVVAEDQPESVRGRIKEGCDDFGVPSETAKVKRPEVTTVALAKGAYKDELHDVAQVRGGMPDLPARMLFEVFMKPEAGAPKYGADWQPVTNADGSVAVWTADEAAAVGCEAQKVAQTKPVTVKGKGDYKSPAVTAGGYGTMFWVETLEIQDPDSGEFVQVHRGECGLVNETTLVEIPKVSTKAVVEAVPGDLISDTAIVEGELSKHPDVQYAVTFQAYQPKSEKLVYRDENGKEVLEPSEEYCTTETLLFESSKPVKVTKPGEYDSETFQVGKEHEGKIFWVETLWQLEKGKEKLELHRGKCGIPNETTTVTKPKVKTTAVTSAVAGDVIYDTAHVTGSLPVNPKVRYELTFQAYQTRGLTGDKRQWCEAKNLVWESNTPAVVTKLGDYRSEDFKTTAEDQGTIFWVETLWQVEDGKDKVQLHRGECGAENEVTTLQIPELPVTGYSGGLAVVVVGLLTMGVGLLVYSFRLTRRKAV